MSILEEYSKAQIESIVSFLDENISLLERDDFEELDTSLHKMGELHRYQDVWKFIYHDLGINYLNYMNYVPDSAFDGDWGLGSFALPVHIRAVGKFAFGSCDLNPFVFNEELETIKERAFQDNPLKIINLPKSVEIVENEAFYGCTPEKIIVNNPSCRIGRGALYDWEGDLKECTLPSKYRGTKYLRHIFGLEDEKDDDFKYWVESIKFNWI